MLHWRYKMAVVLAALALMLATVALLWLLLWPGFYQGVEIAPALEGATQGQQETRSFSASLLEVNGFRVLPVLLAPVLLTGLGLTGLYLHLRWVFSRGRLVLRMSAAFLLAIVLLAIFSVGSFYLPSALLLGIAAIIVPRSAALRAVESEG